MEKEFIKHGEEKNTDIQSEKINRKAQKWPYIGGAVVVAGAALSIMIANMNDRDYSHFTGGKDKNSRIWY